jgi:SAM-dependent methyltransferase
MQREKTIQFWDNYHDENDSEEWISKPGEELLEMIFDRIYDGKTKENLFPCHQQCFSILEIGCGTSTLVRDLKRYIEERLPTIEVVACGTDASKVCVAVNTERDCHNDSPSETSERRGSLWYEVLNVLDGAPSRKNWDLIIDKGCLDTFLFRSRHRGTHNKTYPESLRILLDNLHVWQTRSTIAGSGTIGGDDVQSAALLPNTDGNNNPNDNERTSQQSQQPGGATGVYVIITPRPKLKAVRDYAGFSSVRRYPLPKVSRSKLEGKKNNDSNNQLLEGERCRNSNGGESQDACATTASPGFMFVCTKNDDYRVGVSMPFPASSCMRNGNNNNNPPDDDIQCSRCKRTFREFRKEGGLEFRGMAYCIRKWKSHCIHCKSDPVQVS